MDTLSKETAITMGFILAIARKVGMTPEELTKESSNIKANTDFILDMIKAKIK